MRYYCNPKIAGAEIISARGVGPCSFRIEVDTNYACHNATEIQNVVKENQDSIKSRVQDYRNGKVDRDFEQDEHKKFDKLQFIL